MQEWTEDYLFAILTLQVFSLIVIRNDSSVVTGNLFLAAFRWALYLPRCIEHKGMRQDHAARAREQREVEIGIEAAGRAESAAVVNSMIADAVRLVISNGKIVNGSCIIALSDAAYWEVEILSIG